MKFGSLFSGIGGMDLGLERAGMTCAWQVENNGQARAVLERHWPNAKRYGDIRQAHITERTNVIAGGDPCPKHSRARSNGDSRHPDLAGYFLAVVGRLRPEWVVRENVPAPTVDHFTTALEYLGYGAVVIRTDAAKITGQTRQRDFIVARYQTTWRRVRECFSDCPYGSGAYITQLKTRPVIPALTTHRTRYDSRDCYVWEPARGLRILDGQERQAFAGLPENWLAGLSEAAIARMCGNAVVPQVAEWIGRRIIEAEEITLSANTTG